MSAPSELTGPDLGGGIAASDLTDGSLLLGHVGEEAVLLARSGDEIFAVGATCTHYGGPLVRGLLEGDTVRCPLHHACFSLRTGAALRAPALDALACWAVERRGERLFVLGKASRPAFPLTARPGHPSSIVIVGGGAAALAAAAMLRREGYGGKLTLLSADDSPPCDRPNLSKDYLAGTAPEEWMSLRPPEFFTEQRIELLLGTHATAIDLKKKEIVVAGGAIYPYGALLLATGASPTRPSVPGIELPHVHTLRTLADSRAIIARLGATRRAVVLGASFIGLEVAASLRARGIETHVVAPDTHPLGRVLGPELGDFIRAKHEEHGVVFHLGQTPTSIDARSVTLSGGDVVEADLVIVGTGVRPSVALAEAAGLAMDRGVLVDEYLQTSADAVFAAGDIARWPDPHTGERLRVEHWTVAERHGQIAARNMLGARERCTIVPFFWSQHYDTTISYVGHAETWDRIDVDGSPSTGDCTATFKRGGQTLAVATIGRDLASLRAEVEMEA